MANKVNMAFEPKSVIVDIGDILPVKHFSKGIRNTRKYRQIAASIREIGIIEPPVVIRHSKGKFLLLDGHLRIQILGELGETCVTCLIARDDEAFTYNKRVNRLASVQEHKMILKAIKNGVPEERIAKALDVNIANIRQKQRMLDGICPEAIEMLKDKHCSINTFRVLRKMTPLRQIEVADMMISMDNYSVIYTQAMLAATPQDQLVEQNKPKQFKGISPEQIARMETEMANLQREVKLVEDSYGPDHLILVLTGGYLVSLLDNGNIKRFLERHHREILNEFQKIAEVVSVGTEEPG